MAVGGWVLDVFFESLGCFFILHSSHLLFMENARCNLNHKWGLTILLFSGWMTCNSDTDTEFSQIFVPAPCGLSVKSNTEQPLQGAFAKITDLPMVSVLCMLLTT